MQQPDITAIKQALRKKLRHRRRYFVRSLPDHHHALMFRIAPTPLAHLLGKADLIGAYVAGPWEPDSINIAQRASAGRPIALPYFSSRDAPMEFRLWGTDDPLESGPFGIDQPEATAPPASPDLLLMPLLGFDRQRNRIGQGGGHYDRYLGAHPDCTRVGMAWAVQEVDAVPVEATDIPLNAILTEKEWISAA